MSLHWILLVCLIFPVKPSPHQPLNLTWVITNAASGDILNQTTHIGPLGTWFPDLYFDLGLLLQLTWQDKFIQKHHFYVCPAHDQTKADRNTCGGVDSYFCASWSCVSTGHIWWTAPKGADFIKVTREGQPPCPPKLQEDQEGYCNPVKIHFTSQGKNASGWNTGKSWGIRLYEKTRMFPQDPGALFTIQLLSRSLGSSQPLGPNKVLTGIRRPLLSQVPVPPPTQSPDNSQGPPSVNTPITGTPKITSTLNSGPLGLLQATYEVLNSSHPEMTTDCWLCLDTQLPYYEGIAIPGNYTQVPNNTQCRWQQTGRHKITLQMVTGMGLCIGNKVPSEYLPLCNVTQIPTGSGYLIPPDDSWWACSSGLTPCIHVQVMNDSNDFCVLVQLVPRVLYYQGEDVPHQLAQLETRQKRVAIAAILVPTLWGIGLAGTAGLGTSALILQDKNYKALRQAIDADLEEVEKSISHLQESLSLAEVVLQNRRRLDLLFLQQGGLCLALQEQCCFYANHSGVVKEPMAVLRKRLHDRQLEREQSKSWYGMNPSSSGPLG